MTDTLIQSCKKFNFFQSDSFNKNLSKFTQEESLIISTLKKDGIIRIVDSVKKTQWKNFELVLENNNNQCVVVITDGLPREWVSNRKLKVITVQGILKDTLKKLDIKIRKHNFNHFKRKENVLEFDFFLMYGNWEYFREIVVRALEDRNVLTKSLYSRAPVFGDKTGRSIENTNVPAPQEFRFNHLDNFDNVIKSSQRCRCYIVLENNGLLHESDATITEKSIWPILAQVPFIWCMSPEKIKQLKSWGFFPNDPPKENLRSVVEQLMWLKSEFSNKEKSQKWQDDQAEIINSNLKIIKGLKNRIDEETFEQLKQLGL